MNLQAKESAGLVLGQLIDQLVLHYRISKSEARAIIRQVMLELAY